MSEITFPAQERVSGDRAHYPLCKCSLIKSKNDSDFLSCNPMGGTLECWGSEQSENKLPTVGRSSRTELGDLIFRLKLRSRSGHIVLQLELLIREGRE